MNDELLVNYVIMRTDLESLNPGKAMAQSHHAFGALKHAVRSNLVMQPPYLSWQQQSDQDFGTCIVLGGTEGEINRALVYARRIKASVVAGWVRDRTYPIRDGAVTHMVPLNTCAFVFGTKTDCEDIVRDFKLHE